MFVATTGTPILIDSSMAIEKVSTAVEASTDKSEAARRERTSCKLPRNFIRFCNPSFSTKRFYFFSGFTISRLKEDTSLV